MTPKSLALDGIETILFDLGGTLKVLGQWAWYDDTFENLERLAKDYTLVIAANQPTVTHDFIQATPIAKYFKQVYISESIGKAKPDEAFYKHIIQDMSLDVSKTIMVGDKLTHDIAPAQAVGIKTAWIVRDKNTQEIAALLKNSPVQPDCILTNLTELV